MCRDIKTQSTEIPVYLRDIRVLSAEEATARERFTVHRRKATIRRINSALSSIVLTSE